MSSDAPLAAWSAGDRRPCVMHVVYRFDVGGLENGVVNLLNHMPATAYRHVIVALTDISDFRQRVRRDDVQYLALHKPPGHGVWLYPKLYQLFRAWRPAVVHTRNLAALEAVVPAWLAGVPVRIHGEHGRDVGDLDGNSRRYQWLRRFYRPFVSHYIALSKDLAEYLKMRTGVPARRITQIYNGVDVRRFSPPAGQRDQIAGCPFNPDQHWLVGTVGRMQHVKDQTMLARAFVEAISLQPSLRGHVRLVMVGDGPLRAQVQSVVAAAGLSDLCWLPGERSDVSDVMRGLHCFVLPSLAEGISNTILEAMACGLPVIATRVGGTSELVIEGQTGELLPAGNHMALAHSLVRLAGAPQQAVAWGRAGRLLAEHQFSLPAMVAAYQGLYDRQRALAAGIKEH